MLAAAKRDRKEVSRVSENAFGNHVDTILSTSSLVPWSWSGVFPVANCISN